MELLQELRSNIFYRHFDLPASFPVVGLLGNAWQYQYEKLHRMHFHNCLEVGYLYCGSGQFFVDDTIVHFEAPCLVIAPPNVPHINVVDEGSTCGWKWIYVDPVQLLPNLDPRITNDLIQYQHTLAGADCVISAKDHPRIYALVELIIQEMESGQTGYQAIVRELFHALFLMLMRISRHVVANERYTNTRLKLIAPVISYIVNNYMNDLSVEQLAQLCHVSTSHFRRLFKQILGCSPSDYLQVIRIERACALLYNAEYSVTEIGMQVGYPSPSSFCRQFKSIHHMSPSQWRRKMRSEENPLVTAYFDVVPPSQVQFFPSEYAQTQYVASTPAKHRQK